MKKNFHPQMRPVKIIHTDGEEVQIMMCLPESVGESLVLDLDHKNHPIWQKDKEMSASTRNKRVSSFNKKFEGMGL